MYRILLWARFPSDSPLVYRVNQTILRKKFIMLKSHTWHNILSFGKFPIPIVKYNNNCQSNKNLLKSLKVIINKGNYPKFDLTIIINQILITKSEFNPRLLLLTVIFIICYDIVWQEYHFRSFKNKWAIRFPFPINIRVSIII